MKQFLIGGLVALALLMPAPVAASTPTVAQAKAYVLGRLGAVQYSCVDKLWAHESGWNPRAGAPSGSYGIPQADPGRKMASVGADWLTNPITQVKWGLRYIHAAYGTACHAWAHWLRFHWY